MRQQGPCLARRADRASSRRITMKSHLSLAFLFLVCPAVASAQDVPERLLSDQTQVYLRWDGLEAHRAAFDKTALAQIMKGDMGQFVSEVGKQVKEKIQGALSIGQILGGIPPDLVEKIQTDGAEASKLLEVVGKHGVILGIEVRALDPPAVQATLVFPPGGKPDAPCPGLLRTAPCFARPAGH